MKTLVNTFYNLELRLIENAITVLSVEAPSAYQKIMHDFWQQYNGNEGSFILSENGTVGTTQAKANGEFQVKISPMISGTNIEVLVYDKKIFSILYKFEKLIVKKDLFTL